MSLLRTVFVGDSRPFETAMRRVKIIGDRAAWEVNAAFCDLAVAGKLRFAHFLPAPKPKEKSQ